MARTFRKTDGDIAAVLSVMFASREFTASLGQKFKDPVHYLVSAVRLAYDVRPISNAEPMVRWLGELGEIFRFAILARLVVKVRCKLFPFFGIDRANL